MGMQSLGREGLGSLPVRVGQGNVAGSGLAVTGTEDFTDVLRRHGLYPEMVGHYGTHGTNGSHANYGNCGLQGGGQTLVQTQATTILAFKFEGGVLVAGDRRATAGHLVVYDRADKVLQIDRSSLMAIAGVPSTAWEMARVLEHSFQFYRRSQLQEMSLEGKVRALSKLLRDNLGAVLQGIGVVVPMFATYDDSEGIPRLYFYDAMGAQFEAADFAVSGSGSPAVRSILHYEDTWGRKALRHLRQSEAALLALRALDTAAESDTATGGVDRRGRVYPILKFITRDGITSMPEKELARLYRDRVR